MVYSDPRRLRRRCKRFVAGINDKKNNLVEKKRAIVYNEKEIISANRTNDISLTVYLDNGWGWLVKKKFDFIQTDWLSALEGYLEHTK